MRLIQQTALCLMMCLTLLGCVHLGSVSTSSVPADRSKLVVVETSRFLFLFINFNNDYVNELARDLAEQCPRGKVEGVLTKHENITYFPLFAHAVRITASGYCIEAGDQ